MLTRRLAQSSRHLLSSSSASSPVHRLPSRNYYPSTPAQHATATYALPLLGAIPCLAIYWYGRADYEEKTKAMRRTVSGGADFEERLKRKRVKIPRRAEQDES